MISGIRRAQNKSMSHVTPLSISSRLISGLTEAINSQSNLLSMHITRKTISGWEATASGVDLVAVFCRTSARVDVPEQA